MLCMTPMSSKKDNTQYRCEACLLDSSADPLVPLICFLHFIGG
ncbi:hypothetical protein HMPREF3214_00296 [Alloscardovia omnicolens]|nr:hypothetical protein HMPREF3214_00296 [Alloscardovia omnicolens]